MVYPPSKRIQFKNTVLVMENLESASGNVSGTNPKVDVDFYVQLMNLKLLIVVILGLLK